MTRRRSPAYRARQREYRRQCYLAEKLERGDVARIMTGKGWMWSRQIGAWVSAK